MIVKRIVLILTILVAMTQVQPWSLAESQAGGEKSFKNLHDLMEEGIHDRFTFLSFTLWHDQNVTPEKMDAVARSADQLSRLAEDIPALRPQHLETELMKDDLKAFDAGAAELSNSAMMLAQAAAVRDRRKAEKLFSRLVESCRSCHAKFNKELAHK